MHIVFRCAKAVRHAEGNVRFRRGQILHAERDVGFDGFAIPARRDELAPFFAESRTRVVDGAFDDEKLRIKVKRFVPDFLDDDFAEPRFQKQREHIGAVAKLVGRVAIVVGSRNLAAQQIIFRVLRFPLILWVNKMRSPGCCRLFCRVVVGDTPGLNVVGKLNRVHEFVCRCGD